MPCPYNIILGRDTALPWTLSGAEDMTFMNIINDFNELTPQETC